MVVLARFSCQETASILHAPTQSVADAQSVIPHQGVNNYITNRVSQPPQRFHPISNIRYVLLNLMRLAGP